MPRVSDQDVFLKRLKELRGSCGNLALRQKLGWQDEKYWRIRDELLDLGLVAKGRGQGGTIRLVEDGDDEPVPKSSKKREPRTEERAYESSLYLPFAQTLRGDWAREERLDTLAVEVTARQARRSTGGTWTRPDVTVVSRRTFRYVPSSQFDVWTFEIKTADAIDVVGVFEAAAHARRATRAFVAFQVPPTPDAEQEDVLKRCESEAERIGVGLIAFVRPDQFQTWDIRVPARGQNTPADLIDEFIAEQLSDAAKDKIRGWNR
jgi:hypothetical protein